MFISLHIQVAKYFSLPQTHPLLFTIIRSFSLRHYEFEHNFVYYVADKSIGTDFLWNNLARLLDTQILNLVDVFLCFFLFDLLQRLHIWANSH